MRGEGCRVGWAGADDVGGGGCSRVGPVVFGLGVEVVRRARGVGRRDGGKWGWGLGEGVSRGLKDAVVVDGCDVGASGGFGLTEAEMRRQQESGGLSAEDAASGCHSDEEACGRKSTPTALGEMSVECLQ